MNTTLFIFSVEKTPLGVIWLAASEAGLVGVEFETDADRYSVQLRKHFPSAEICRYSHGRSSPELILERAAQEIIAYLAGEGSDFTFPIDWSRMGPFQRAVLRETFSIPYGQVLTYAEIASRVGHPRASRAVGRAEATNPMPLVIPCHRVIGSDGKLHGYGGPGGIATKQKLIEMERNGGI